MPKGSPGSDRSARQSLPAALSQPTTFAFALLCVLTASQWLILPPNEAPLGSGQRAVAFLAAGLLASALSSWQRVSLHVVLRLSLGGVLLLGVPEVLSGLGGASIIDQVAISALIPVVTVVLLAATANGTLVNVSSFLVPAVVGLSGVLLILPTDLLQIFPAFVSLLPPLIGALCIASSSVWLARVLPLTQRSVGIAIVCLSNGTLLLVSTLLKHEGVPKRLSLRSLAQEGSALLQMVVLLWLIRAMEPHRLATRFFLVPAMTLVEGCVLLRGGINARNLVGACLCVGAAGVIALAPSPEHPQTLSLR